MQNSIHRFTFELCILESRNEDKAHLALARICMQRSGQSTGKRRTAEAHHACHAERPGHTLLISCNKRIIYGRCAPVTQSDQMPAGPQARQLADLATVTPLSKIKGSCFSSFSAAAVALDAASSRVTFLDCWAAVSRCRTISCRDLKRCPAGLE